MSTKRKVKARLNYDPLLDDSGHRRNRIWSFPATAEAFDAMVWQMAEGTDKLAFHEYKEGECLPRGYECSTAERVNEMQGWRQHKAIAGAVRALAAIGITRPKEGK